MLPLAGGRSTMLAADFRAASASTTVPARTLTRAKDGRVTISAPGHHFTCRL